MSDGGSSVRARPAGGFNAGFGDSNEHLDEDAMQSAMQQKSLAQQATTASGSGLAGAGGMPQASAGAQQHARPVTPSQELKWMVEDVGKGLMGLLDLNVLLTGSQPGDTPEQQAKKNQMHQRMQAMNQEEEKIVREKYAAESKRQQQEQEREQAENQQRAQAQRQQMVVPSSVQKGAAAQGGKSRKSQASMQLEQDRKKMPGPSKVN